MTERDAERVARQFHEVYERLAPEYGYETRSETRVEWDDLPPANRLLMVAVVAEVLGRAALVARDADVRAERDLWRKEHARAESEAKRAYEAEQALRARDAELAGLREQLGVARGDDSAGEPPVPDLAQRLIDSLALPPLDTAGVLWVAAIDRVPIGERIGWVKTLEARVESINASRASATAPLALPSPEQDDTREAFWGDRYEAEQEASETPVSGGEQT